MSESNGQGTVAAPSSITTRPQPLPPLPDGAETAVIFETADGQSWRAQPVQITWRAVVFEIYNPGTVVPVSAVLSPFQLALQKQFIFAGKAVVTKVVESGTKVICECDLDEKGWQIQAKGSYGAEPSAAAAAFQKFTIEWQKFYKISPEFKLAVGDLQHFLHDLRLWLDGLEASLHTLPPARQAETEQEIGKQLLPVIATALDSLFERFEIACRRLPPDSYSEHRIFCHRQLHPLLMCCPFMHRIFAKPLGYAGDYEMIDMIIRNRLEGENLFAKMLQAYILDQAPARSVRNRADYFVRKFLEETARVSSTGGTANFFSLGCGPAREVEAFLANHTASNSVQFTLLDFSAETLKATGQKLRQIAAKYGRRTQVITINKSVNALLKDSSRSQRSLPAYDFIYCSGLYDYLSDRVCVQLNTHLYDQLKPGGLLVVTNFDPSNPIRNMMEYVFEWFLIHRDSPHLARLIPEQAAADDCRVIADATGCNVFLEARKPE